MIRRRHRSLRAAAIATMALAVVLAGTGACTSSRSRTPAPGAAAGTGPGPRPSSSIAAAAPSSSTTAAADTTTSTTDPGLLPQTHDLPSATAPDFTAHVVGLWQAIVSGDPTTAMSFFFPLSAYRQVKAIADPVSDWQNRLVANYRVDIERLHGLLGAQPATAALVRMDVPTSQAVWVPPGAEYNKGSYYRVYGTRLVYQQGGQSRSFPVYSLISWRGKWYVVHLGPIR